MENSACFCGHRDVSIHDTEMESKIHNTLLDLYQNHNIVNFLSGGMGNFDTICENEVLILKKTYPEIKLFLVIPYFTKKTDNPLNYKYDALIYPNFRNQYHYKQIITRRNEYIVNNSEYIIAKVNYNHGGAYNTLKYAKKNNKKIILI